MLPEVVERGTVNLKFVWDDSLLQEKVVLIAMSELAGQENWRVTEDEIGIALRFHDIVLPPGEMATALRDLIGREVLTRADGDFYRLSVDLMRMWLLGNQRIEWLEEEQLETVRAWQALAEAVPSISARGWRRLVVPVGVSTVVLGAIVGGFIYAWPGAGDGPLPTPTSTQEPFEAEVVYDIGRCETTVVPGSDGLASVDTCVMTISSENQGRLLRVAMTWTAHVTIPGVALTKVSDERNPKMVLEDSQGNEYFYVDLGGAARGQTELRDGDTVEGWFLFPVPVLSDPPFALVDKDQDVRIGGIELNKPG